MEEPIQSEKKSITAKEIISTALIPGGLALIYLSFAFFALNWRVSNEPGYSTVWGLLVPGMAFCGLGGLVFLAGNVLLIANRSKLIFLGWVLCVPVTIGAASLAPILLLLMV